MLNLQQRQKVARKSTGQTSLILILFKLQYDGKSTRENNLKIDRRMICLWNFSQLTEPERENNC